MAGTTRGKARTAKKSRSAFSSLHLSGWDEPLFAGFQGDPSQRLLRHLFTGPPPPPKFDIVGARRYHHASYLNPIRQCRPASLIRFLGSHRGDVRQDTCNRPDEFSSVLSADGALGARAYALGESE